MQASPLMHKEWLLKINLNLLLILIGKSVSTQTVFGNGYDGYGKDSGQLDSKGLFYCKKGSNYSYGKVFGIENYWGNQYRFCLGCVAVNGMPKIKLTYGTSDGSTADGYNLTGDGYIDIPDISTSSNGYISKMKFVNNIMFPSELNGSATTKYCDYFKGEATGTRISILYGGKENEMGAFAMGLNRTETLSGVDTGSTLSCKPLNTP